MVIIYSDSDVVVVQSVLSSVEIPWWMAAEQYRAWRTDIQKKLMDQA